MTFTRLAWAFAFSATWASAADYLPLVSGNSWTLATRAGATMTLTVTATEVAGPARRARLRWQTPWGDSTLLIRAAPRGIEHEGFLLGESSTHFAVPGALFLDGPKGAVWSDSVGTSVLFDDDATVATRNFTYRGVRHYVVIYSESQRLNWFLARGTGFVRFGEGDDAFVLTSANVRTEPAPAASPGNGPCALMGVDPNPPISQGISAEAHDAAIRTAVSAGSRYLDVPLYWRLVEPTPGNFDWSKLQEALYYAAIHDLAVSVTIKTANTTGRELPPDLVRLAWDDPVLLSRWTRFLTVLGQRLNSQVRWVNLANEVDFYFYERSGEVEAFRSFFRSGSEALRRVHPSASTGLVFAHDSVRYTDRVLRQLRDLGEHVAFTYYSLDGVKARPVTEAAIDIPDMVNLAAGKPVIITEIGYSSSEAAGSSPGDQQMFFAVAFDALYRLAGNVRAARVFQLSDLPLEAADILARSLGQSGNSAFVAHLGALGIFERSGSPKPAWDIYRIGATAFTAPNACLVRPPSE
jgi:hypothetical protein